MKINEVALYENKSHSILKESWNTLTEDQQVYVSRWEKELWPLLEQYSKLSEASLSVDQIKQIFAGAEKSADATGNNTSSVGKVANATGAALKLPVDLAKSVDAKINQLGKLAQNAGPVKNIDVKFDQLKKDIADKNSDSKIIQGIESVSDWAKANPGKATIAVAILTTVAAFAGGPAGGAAAGLILRSTKNLLQGDDLSSAVGKSVKTAAYGALAGATFNYISDQIVDNIATAQDAELEAMRTIMQDENYAASKAELFSNLGIDNLRALDGTIKLDTKGHLNNFYYSYNTIIPSDQVSTFNTLRDAISGAGDFSPEFYKASGEYHDFMGKLVNTEEAKSLTAALIALREIPKDVVNLDQFLQVMDKAEDGMAILTAMDNAGGDIALAAQNAVQLIDDKTDNSQKSKPINPKIKKQLELNLNSSSAKSESNTMRSKLDLYIAEATPSQRNLGLDNPNTVGAKIKRGAGNLASKSANSVKQGASAVGSKISQTGKNITTTVTANKLMKAWTKNGSPTDTGSIMNILSGAGLDNTQIAQIGKEVNVRLRKPKASGINIKSLAAMIQKTSPEIIALVKQQLTSPAAGKRAPTKKPVA